MVIQEIIKTNKKDEETEAKTEEKGSNAASASFIEKIFASKNIWLIAQIFVAAVFIMGLALVARKFYSSGFAI